MQPKMLSHPAFKLDRILARAHRDACNLIPGDEESASNARGRKSGSVSPNSTRACVWNGRLLSPRLATTSHRGRPCMTGDRLRRLCHRRLLIHCYAAAQSKCRCRRERYPRNTIPSPRRTLSSQFQRAISLASERDFNLCNLWKAFPITIVHASKTTEKMR